MAGAVAGKEGRFDDWLGMREMEKLQNSSLVFGWMGMPTTNKENPEVSFDEGY
jgi:hypothetical protein